MKPTTLGLIGFSTRALAQAAVDLGFQVQVVDAFCDQDTRELAVCHAVDEWPHQLDRLAESINCDAWLLAGGMENYSRVVERLARDRPVLGPNRIQVRRLRSRRFLRSLASSAPGLCVPAVAKRASELATTARIVNKPWRSSGGRNIFAYDTASISTCESTTLARTTVNSSWNSYWQTFVAGRPLGVVCVLSDQGVEICGATIGLPADAWPAPQPFAYRGSIGPAPLSENHCEVIQALVRPIADKLKYRGWLQIDFIVDEDDRLWLLEFNPRWSAGMEILHRCAVDKLRSPLASHMNAWALDCHDHSAQSSLAHRLAKAILYAPCDLVLNESIAEDLKSFRSPQPVDNFWWDIADVPTMDVGADRHVGRGEPFFTLRLWSEDSCRSWDADVAGFLGSLASIRRWILDRWNLVE